MPRARAKAPKEIQTTLVADKVTKGAVRFSEDKADWPLNIYLRKEQVAELGVEAEEGATITLTLSA